MNVSIFDKTHFRTTNWSGGSTTQLYISPANASIAERNFDFRLSTASVEVEESTFTALADVQRKLMVLEGEIELSHENQHTIALKPFEIDVFSGGWNTRCLGTCVDFNLMTTGDRESDLSSLHLAKKSQSNFKLDVQWKTTCLYLLEGAIELTVDEKKYALNQNQLLVIDHPESISIPLEVLNDCRIVVVKIG